MKRSFPPALLAVFCLIAGGAVLRSAVDQATHSAPAAVIADAAPVPDDEWASSGSLLPVRP